MNNKRARNGFIPVVLGIFSMMLLGGCTHADPVALGTFMADLLRNVASALLL